MTSADIKVVDGYLVNQVQGWSRMQLLESAGLVAQGSREIQIRATSDFYFGNRFAQYWWKYEAQRGYDPEFVSLVESVLQEVDENRNQQWLIDLRADLASNVDGA